MNFQVDYLYKVCILNPDLLFHVCGSIRRVVNDEQLKKWDSQIEISLDLKLSMAEFIIIAEKENIRVLNGY